MTRYEVNHTQAAAMDECKRLGFSLKKTGWGDYRLVPLSVFPPESAEEVAYYTPDLDDAVATARNWR